MRINLVATLNAKIESGLLICYLIVSRLAVGILGMRMQRPGTKGTKIYILLSVGHASQLLSFMLCPKKLHFGGQGPNGKKNCS